MHHDANYWAALAAWASAIAALLGVLATAISVAFARRSARAAEVANVRSTRAALSLHIDAEAKAGDEDLTLHIDNAGPGIAHYFEVWPADDEFVPGEMYSGRSSGGMRVLASPLPAHGTATLLIPGIEPTGYRDMVASWDDDVGNREQLHFREWDTSQPGGLGYGKRGFAQMSYAEVIGSEQRRKRRRRTREALERWYARIRKTLGIGRIMEL